jgi:thioredoxin 2
MGDLSLDHLGVLTRCPSCSATNRLRYETLDKTTRCGKCRTTLAAPASPIEVSGSQVFDQLVAQASVPVIVDFWAPWCGPCRVMAPELEKAARSLSGQALVVKVNTDAEPELGSRFRIRSIPTLAVIFQGRELARLAGARSAAEIRTFADQSIADASRRPS